MPDDLTLLELAERVGEPPDRLREWCSLRLIGRDGRERFGAADVERARLVRQLLRRGLHLPAIASANDHAALLARYVELAFPDGVGATYSLEAAAARIGLGVEIVRRFCDASGASERDEPLHEDDLHALAGIKVALDAGLPEEAVVQLARVCVDALGRVAEAESRLTHFYVHERIAAQGISGRDLASAERASADHLVPLVEPMVLYFHRKGWRRALAEDAVMHFQEHAGVRGRGHVPGELVMAVAFIDLAGFTALADAMGDEMAAQVLDRFSEIVRDAVARSDGRIVKQIGDAFMLVFPEARSALVAALEVERRTRQEPHFPALRSGIHHGHVLYREGDYLGTSVNVAARVAGEAARHQLLVTAPVRTEAGELPDVDFVPIGSRRLRGIAGEMELFAVVARSAGEAVPRLVDPVCRMELGAREVAARLTAGGEEHAFCSQQCLQRFVAAPERYGGKAER